MPKSIETPYRFVPMRFSLRGTPSEQHPPANAASIVEVPDQLVIAFDDRIQFGPPRESFWANGITYTNPVAHELVRGAGAKENWLAQIAVVHADPGTEDQTKGFAKRVVATQIDVFCTDQGMGHNDLALRLGQGDRSVLQEGPRIHDHGFAIDAGLAIASPQGDLRAVCETSEPSLGKGDEVLFRFKKLGPILVFSSL